MEPVGETIESEGMIGNGQDEDQRNVDDGAGDGKSIFLLDDSSDLDELESVLSSSKLPKCIGDVELLENALSAWRNQNSDNDSREREINQQKRSKEIMRKNADEKIADLEKTVELMQKNIDALHNDLNWIDNLHKDIGALNEKIAELEDELQAEIDDSIRLKKENADALQSLQVSHHGELEQIKTELETELENVKTESENHRKRQQEEIEHFKLELIKVEEEKLSEISILKMEYENKLRKLQQKKMATPLNQQQAPAFNQDIYRKKLQHLKTEYEQENSTLKNQMKLLQQQLNANNIVRKSVTK